MELSAQDDDCQIEEEKAEPSPVRLFNTSQAMPDGPFYTLHAVCWNQGCNCAGTDDMWTYDAFHCDYQRDSRHATASGWRIMGTPVKFDYQVPAPMESAAPRMLQEDFDSIRYMITGKKLKDHMPKPVLMNQSGSKP